MCLDPEFAFSVPAETARIARAAFPKGNLYMKIRDELGPIFEDRQFADLYPPQGQPGEAPWRLAFVTVLQFAEGLSDRQASDAVRSRIDWKYALGVELSDPGFDSSVLSEFRTRLITGSAEEQLFETLLNLCRERGFIQARGRQRTDSTHVLAAVRALNRFELVGEAMRHALDTLATEAPDFLQDWIGTHVQPEQLPQWSRLYSRRVDDYRLPKKEKERQLVVEAIGRDGQQLLFAVYAAKTLPELREIPAVEALRRIWVQNYYQINTKIEWRDADNIPPSRQFLSSPLDVEAHLAKKRSTRWVGYKVHLSETCEEDQPHLITHVETTAAPVSDGEATPLIHQALESKCLLPETHIVDTGYIDAGLLVTSKRDFQVNLLGPARLDTTWQAQEAKGFDATHFSVDWQNQRATCPEGHESVSWRSTTDKQNKRAVTILFSSKDCADCPRREICSHSAKTNSGRRITLSPQEHYEALTSARDRMRTAEFRAEYARRAGIEGTLSRTVRREGIRRSAYIGQIKVHLGNVLAATALNFLRIGEWLAGTPRSKTRISPFARMMAPLIPV